MQLREVCEACGLTRKAVDYYERQGLIQPQYAENGYRNFTESDVARLREIALFRRLGLGSAEIRKVLAAEGEERRMVLEQCRDRVELALRSLQVQRDVFDEMLTHGYESVSAEEQERIRQRLDHAFPVRERLRQAFPGAFGAYLDVHFGPFLDIKMTTVEQTSAYLRIIEFLEQVEENGWFDEAEEHVQIVSEGWSEEGWREQDAAMKRTLDNPRQQLEEQRESIEAYLVYRQSPEYQASPAGQAMRAMREFQRRSGYAEVFIPNLIVLSPDYREYQNKLVQANKELLAAFPESLRVLGDES
ncbi:MerR family transcriptional regulator [Saccharibacillus sacchari]|uniref:MerR family transcriptional regulator n=1 Tax=Saccharibacillus sacchari TaxID=456493 RepID=UPI0004B66A84|nr:MerR family transcriptional regulator [Saccharibacillus sacchari]